MFGKDNKPLPDEEKKQPPAEKVKGFIYRCITTCTYDGGFYREGETILLPEKKEVPHFEPVEK